MKQFFSLLQMPTKQDIDNFMSGFITDFKGHVTYKYLDDPHVIGCVAVVFFDESIYEWTIGSAFCAKMQELGDNNPYWRYTNPNFVTIDQEKYRQKSTDTTVF